MSLTPNNSSDPTNPPPPPLARGSLPGARDFHRAQFARLQQVLQQLAPDPLGLLDPPDRLENEDPRARLDRLEKQARQVSADLAAAQANVVRLEILEHLAGLDLQALKVLRDQLIQKSSSK